MKLREYWRKKSLKQRIYLCVGLGFILIFLFFAIKGSFFDKRVPDNPQTEISQSESEDSEQENSGSEGEDSEIHFRVNWIDIGVLAVLFTAYGIHKYREKKKEKRL